MKRWAQLIFLMLFLSVVLWQLNGCRDATIKTSSGEVHISLKDKKLLEYFFRELVIYDCAGYTLLGTKPASFGVILKPVFKWDALFLWHAFLPSNLKKYRAWQTWKKYEHFFKKENIAIWAEPSPWVENVEFIVVANKVFIEQIYQENQKDFNLLAKFSAETVDPKILFRESLRFHEGLLGALLGYGRNNGELFHKNERDLLKPMFQDECEQLFKNKKAAFHFTLGWPHVPMEKILMYPAFMANPTTKETEQLRQNYLETREKILSFYKNKDFLEATLSAL